MQCFVVKRIWVLRSHQVHGASTYAERNFETRTNETNSPVLQCSVLGVHERRSFTKVMRNLKILVISGLCVLIQWTVYKFSLPSHHTEVILEPQRPTRVKNPSIKSILIWNDNHRIESGSKFGDGTEAFVENGCRVTQCQILRNKLDLPFGEYDAIVINLLQFDYNKFIEFEGDRRQNHQRYIFLSQEPPNKLLSNWTELGNFFNWSMTYKLDSDIHLVYGRVHAKLSAPGNAIQVQRMINQTHSWSNNYSFNKTRSVVWMVSNCRANNKRETYVSELSKYIDVDVYGQCGNYSCRRDELNWISNPRCYEQIAQTYRFYLSFENSNCRDYVTEKFYEILSRDIVPVVLGGANYRMLAPTHSFIDASSYTPRQLARYLHRLTRDDKLYNQYFWWKEHYEVQAGAKHMARRAFCDVCQQLHEDATLKIYAKVGEHWNEKTQCFPGKSWLIHR